MIINNVDVSKMMKAQKKFEEFRNIFKKTTHTDYAEFEIKRAGMIQAFEYSYELAWKTMKRLLDAQGITVNSPREAFRAAALNNLIDDPEAWFSFIKIRNIVTHTYDEEEAEIVVDNLDDFSKELSAFLKKIGAIS